VNILVFLSGVFIAVPLLWAWVIDRMWLIEEKKRQAERGDNLDE
jgi:hypothetical protein